MEPAKGENEVVEAVLEGKAEVKQMKAGLL